MLNKIDEALRNLMFSELGYTVDPDVMSFQNLREDEFPVCIYEYGEETAAETQTIANFVNDMELSFEIIVLSDETNYRKRAFEQLSRVKQFINNARGLIELKFPDACIIDLNYVGASVLGMDNERAAGGILVKTVISYKQCRTNPEFPACGGSC